MLKKLLVTMVLTGDHTFCKWRVGILQYNYQFTVWIYDVGGLDARFRNVGGGLPLHRGSGSKKQC